MKRKYYILFSFLLATGLLFSCKHSKPKAIKKPDIDLEEAIERRDVNAAKYWIQEQRYNTTLRFPHGVTPLMLVAKTGNEEILQAALNTDWNVNATDNEKNTPLHWAVMYKKPKAVEMLVKAGANINADEGWKTPLNLAIRNRDLEMVKLLINLGADVNKKDTTDETPLMWAATWGQGDIIKVLLENGAKTGNKDIAGDTALSRASREFCSECVKMLIEAGEDVNNGYEKGKIPLLIAGEYCDDKAAQILIEAGADVTVKDEDGNTPFILSAKSNCTDDGDIKLYASSGVDITAKNKFGYTALDYAEDNPRVLDKDLELLRHEIAQYKSRH